MKQVLRTVLSVLAGLITAVLLLIAVEAFSAVVHPFPEGFVHTPEEMCRHVANYPQWVLAAVVPMWGAIAFVSVWLTAKIGNLTSAVIVGTLFMAAVIANVMMLPYPQWFSIVTPLAAIIAVAIAVRLKLYRNPTTCVAESPVNNVRSDRG